MVQDPTQMLCALVDHILCWATKLGIKIQSQNFNVVKQDLTQARSIGSKDIALSALRFLLAGIEQPFALLLGKLLCAREASCACLVLCISCWSA